MTEFQAKLEQLIGRGWTKAVLADAVGVHQVTIRRWQLGTRAPENAKMVLLGLEQLLRRRRVPKKRRYAPGAVSRPQHSSVGQRRRFSSGVRA